jgi:Immunoglobulin I-set domain
MLTGAQKNASIVEKNKVVLQCPARGTPLPKIRWYKNGNPLSGNEIGERVMADGSLQLEHAHANNTGRYTCIAENVAGNVSHTIELIVYG